jgi:hypothetical protein
MNETKTTEATNGKGGTMETATTTRRTVSKCECGRRKSQYATHCRKCELENRAYRIAEAVAIVETGKCPECGATLRRNLSLAGWWQCSQYGAEGFRADSAKPSCCFQTFTA